MKFKMRKVKSRFILILFLLLGYLNSTAQNLVVSGITDPIAANGTYVPNGTLYGQDSWVHESGGYYIYNDEYGTGSGDYYWNIDDNTSDIGYVLFFSTNPSTAASPVGLSFDQDAGDGTPSIIEQVSASAPTATTNAASSITAVGATLNGTVNANNASTTVTFEYGLTTSYGTSVTADESPVTGSSNTSVSKSINGLSPNTTYHFRVVGVNSEGTTNGSDGSFTTSAVPATVTTQAVTDITKTTATGNGNITDLGAPNPTQHGVCWNTSGLPTLSDNYTEEGTVSATGAFTSSITSLSPNITYYVRAYVTNTAGTTYGTQVSFTTDPQEATVTTQAVTSIATTTATGNGNITDLGAPNPSQHGVCWNTLGTPTLSDDYTEEGTVSATGAFTSNITSLSPYTTYYVRAYATNTAGTSYGTQVSFTTSPSLTTVTTQDATDITQTTATGNGTITAMGVPDPTAHGVCWNATGSPTLSDSYTDEGAVSSTGAFTSDITSLSPNTTYYVRAYVTNLAGTTYGVVISFTTDPKHATVTTQDASNIDITSVTANGNITDLGDPDPTQHGFCYNKIGSPSLSDSHVDMGTVSATGEFSTTINFLDPATTYYLKAYVTNTAGTTYGEEVSFTTLPEAAIVTTQAVSSIDQTTAVGNGNITDLGAPNPSQHGVCWNISGTPTLSDSYTEEGTVSATGAFTSNMTSLSPNTTYYVRAYATNTAGTSYGTQVSFTTLAMAPDVTTNVVSEMTTTSATLNGTVNANNSSTTVTFEYGLTDSYGTSVTADESPVTGTSDSPVSYQLTGLTPNTTYHYRVVGTNDGGTSNGADMTFTTTPEPAVITTQAVTNIGITTATGNGNITDLGMPYPTAHGVCWNTDGTPTTDNNKTDEGNASSTGAFSSEMTSLNANTTYYVRAYATNSVGTVYGEEVSFTTLPNPPVATTEAASSITAFSALINGTITANGASTTVTFEYGTSDAYGTTVTADQSPVTGDSETDVSYELTGLSSNTTYHYRVIGTNSGGTTNGSDITFTTLSQEPIVTTGSATSVQPTEATLNGVVNANDLSTTVTFEYGLTTSYGNSVTANESPVTGTSNTDVTANVTGLAPNTSYHFRVVGQNSEATTNGDDQVFTTDKYTQTITFNALDDKTTNDADFDPGATSSLGLEISYTSSNQSVATIVSNQIHIVGEGTTDIEASQPGNDTVYAATPVTQTLTVTQTTGISDVELANIKMYPNPVSDFLYIDIENISHMENVEISIIDMSGKVLSHEKVEAPNYKVNIKNFSSGLYLVEIKTSEGTQKLKLIKK